ncbi:MAG: hypothetical protein ACM3JB_02850 [Acidobacteriaceae bacterium]
MRRINQSGKSIKDQNRWQLWVIIAGNSLFLYGVIQANAIKLEGMRSAFKDAANLLPVGLALVISVVLNGLLSTDAKARLVFLRWHHALPGHRAFTEYAVRDPRIDVSALVKLHGSVLPTDPADQNRAWYRIYKSVETDPAVRQVHRDFLLLRDYAALCLVFIVFYGAVAFYAVASKKVALIYLLATAAQYLLVRQAAFNYGVRFVTTVLARSLGSEKQPVPKTRVKRQRSKSADGRSKNSKDT